MHEQAHVRWLVWDGFGGGEGGAFILFYLFWLLWGQGNITGKIPAVKSLTTPLCRKICVQRGNCWLISSEDSSSCISKANGADRVGKQEDWLFGGLEHRLGRHFYFPDLLCETSPSPLLLFPLSGRQPQCMPTPPLSWVRGHMCEGWGLHSLGCAWQYLLDIPALAWHKFPVIFLLLYLKSPLVAIFLEVLQIIIPSRLGFGFFFCF